MEKRRRSFVSLLICLLCLSLSGAFAAAEDAESLFVYALPAGVTEPCEQTGTVTEEHYATWRYDLSGKRGKPVVGTLYVYTPYGYDPGKQYDILYLMHGGGETAAYCSGPTSTLRAARAMSRSTPAPPRTCWISASPQANARR